MKKQKLKSVGAVERESSINRRGCGKHFMIYARDG